MITRISGDLAGRDRDGAGRDRAELAARLRIVVARCERRLRQQAGLELSPSQSSVLATVARWGPLAPSELAVRERVSRPTITRLVGRLVAQGLVECVADPSDGRSYRVVTTLAGEALRASRLTRKNTYLARVLRGADREELAVLEGAVELLERLLAEQV
jgi:DNA-binding MarR family transcriptional regulator